MTDYSPLARRTPLGSFTVAAGLAHARLGFARAATEQRFVVVLLRGGLDGLATVVPYGDRSLIGIRAPLVPLPVGSRNGMLDLGGFYGLHPALSRLHGLYRAGEILAVQAVAGPYRSRSHFEAQDFMEAGAGHRVPSGWLNRVAGKLLPSSELDAAIALGAAVPPLLRGPVPVGNWAPRIWPAAAPDLYARLIALHRRDPVTGPALQEGMKARGFTEAVLAGAAPPPDGTGFTVLADRAGRLLAAPEGPRLASIEIDGWDTHGDQAMRLGWELRRLDNGLLALRDALDAAWAKTVVLVMTEFGRTAHVNGQGGTDHGSASVALVLGGAVAGGRVIADWPGLGPGRLLEDRDLQPTTDIRSVAKGILADHLRLCAADLADVFPDSDAASPMPNLIRP